MYVQLCVPPFPVFNQFIVGGLNLTVKCAIYRIEDSTYTIYFCSNQATTRLFPEEGGKMPLLYILLPKRGHFLASYAQRNMTNFSPH